MTPFQLTYDAAISFEVDVETPSVLQNDPSRIYVETEAYLTRHAGMLTSKSRFFDTINS